MIRHSPSTPGTEVPFLAEANFLCKVQGHVNGGDQRLRVTEVRTLMKVHAVQRYVMLFTKLRSLQKRLALHEELAVSLTGLGMTIKCPLYSTGQELERTA